MKSDENCQSLDPDAIIAAICRGEDPLPGDDEKIAAVEPGPGSSTKPRSQSASMGDTVRTDSKDKYTIATIAGSARDAYPENRPGAFPKSLFNPTQQSQRKFSQQGKQLDDH